VWLLAAAAGLAALAHYEQVAGAVGKTPPHWPSDAGATLDPTRLTLLMFAHPRCPCTRASLEELNHLLSQCQGSITPHLVFFVPENNPADWLDTTLVQSAKAIPGLSVETDPAGARAKLFGAETSGYVVVYGPDQRLLFSGGITVSRGHAGDNAGISSILSLLTTRDTPARQTRVFGCQLLDVNPLNPRAASVCIKP